MISLTYFGLSGLMALVSACSLHDMASVAPADLLRRASPPGHRYPTVIQNVRVFDGWKMTAPKNIYIHGHTISSPCSNAFEPEVVINGSGKFLIPGLIDSHLHVSKLSDLEILTSYGVTTGIHMACSDYEVCRAFKTNEGLASIITAGTAFTGLGDTGSNLPNRDPFPNLDESDIIANVFNNGSDIFKVAVAPNGPTQDVLNSLITNVHSLNRLAMTHATDTAAYTWAAESLTDGIQHIPSDGILSASIISQIYSNGQFVTPTMTIFKAAFSNPLIMAIVRPNGPMNDTYDSVINNVRALHDAGVPLLAGTDAVGIISANVSIPFGLTMHGELQNLVAAGFSPLEAIRAATVLPALHYRLEDRGVIAPGRRADLVLLNSDPLLNISNSLDIERVWVAGMEYGDVMRLH